MNTTQTSIEDRIAHDEEGREQEFLAFAQALEIEHRNAPSRTASATAQRTTGLHCQAQHHFASFASFPSFLGTR